MSDVEEYQEKQKIRRHGTVEDAPAQINHKKEPDSKHDIHEALYSGTVAQEPPTDRSPYLVQRLLDSKDENLFNHVKFNLVKQHIDELGIEKPRILDIGCGLQVSKKYLKKLGLNCDYFGVDYEARFDPHAVVDLMKPETVKEQLPWQPNVVLMLDVLEHLHEDKEVLKNIVIRIANVVPDDCTLIFTLPQMYRLDRFKLDHLHYPEHKVRFEQHEWRDVLESSLTIENTQGLGYLSVMPYLPMASKRYKPDNRLGRLFNYLRGTAFEWHPLKRADLLLSNTLGKLGFAKLFSNDILFVARKRNDISSELSGE